MIRVAHAMLIGLTLAIVTHVVSLLGVPYVAPHGPYDRLADLGAEGRFVTLSDEGAAADVLPFRDPAFVTAACRYDVSSGPVTVRAELPSSYGAVAFHNRQGQPFYGLTDRAATNGVVEVTILASDDVPAAEEEEETDDRPSIRIVSPTAQGFVLLRLFAPAPTARRGLAELARKASCGRPVSS